jgi:plasmid maintenance system killer protein
MKDDNGLLALKESIVQLHNSIEQLRKEQLKPWALEPIPIDKTGWNFGTYSIHINQRFSDLSLQLQQRFEAQQTSVSTAMVAAEKAVNAALTAAEKAVDKAEQAQSLRNEAQNEFRKSLGDLSGLMWTTKEGTAALDSLRREIDIRVAMSTVKINEMGESLSNMQGKFTMIGVVWGIIVVLTSLGVTFIHH